MICSLSETHYVNDMGSSLPDSYDQLLINITNNNVVDMFHIDYVTTAIIEEKFRRKNKEEM